MTGPPSLAREIGKYAWLLLKLLAVLIAVIVPIAWIFARSVTAGLLVFYGLCLAGMIVFYGWQDYKWKRRDWEREHKKEC